MSYKTLKHKLSKTVFSILLGTKLQKWQPKFEHIHKKITIFDKKWKVFVKADSCGDVYTLTTLPCVSALTTVEHCFRNKWERLRVRMGCTPVCLHLTSTAQQIQVSIVYSSIVVSIIACHAGDRGSIPCRSTCILILSVWYWWILYSETS